MKLICTLVKDTAALFVYDISFQLFNHSLLLYKFSMTNTILDYLVLLMHICTSCKTLFDLFFFFGIHYPVVLKLK